jgi:hypothetical protein
VQVALPIPRELMTLDDWDALPEDDSAHYELQEGVLVVSPKPARTHQKAGIPNYGVVDLDPPRPTITAFTLAAPGDGYAESRTGSGELVVAEPFEVRIDIDGLIDRRPNRSEG